MTPVIIGLIIGALGSLLLAWAMSRTTGVRAGAPLVASNVGLTASETLHHPSLRLYGRPDYVLRERVGGRLYPLEVKPTRTATTLYESDALQLATYMLLLEAQYGERFAGHGIVRYRSTEFRVPLTPALRKQCVSTAERIRKARRAVAVHRSHAVRAKCSACAMCSVCGEALF